VGSAKGSVYKWRFACPKEKGRFLGVLMSVCYYGICHCVADREMYSVFVKKLLIFPFGQYIVENVLLWIMR